MPSISFLKIVLTLWILKCEYQQDRSLDLTVSERKPTTHDSPFSQHNRTWIKAFRGDTWVT